MTKEEELELAQRAVREVMARQPARQEEEPVDISGEVDRIVCTRIKDHEQMRDVVDTLRDKVQADFPQLRGKLPQMVKDIKTLYEEGTGVEADTMIAIELGRAMMTQPPGVPIVPSTRVPSIEPIMRPLTSLGSTPIGGVPTVRTLSTEELINLPDSEFASIVKDVKI